MSQKIPRILHAALAGVASKFPVKKDYAAPAGRVEPELAEPVALPVLSAPDVGPWVVMEWSGDRVVLQSDDFNHDVALVVDGDFGDYAKKLSYAKSLANWLNERLQHDALRGLATVRNGDVRYQPELVSPAAAELADVVPAVEAPEAVADEVVLPLVPAEPELVAESEVAPALAEPAMTDDMPAVTRSRRLEPQPAMPPVSVPDVPLAPVVDFPAQPRAQRHGCHCELPPGEQPGPCVIDLNQRSYCGHAMKGIRRDECKFWRPIQFKR